MQRNKYLDKLGIDRKNYGLNFSSKKDKNKSKWKKQIKKYGFDERETWNMDLIFIEWLYSHLCMYLEKSKIDMTHHKFEFNGKTYTQEQAINKIISDLGNFLKTDFIARSYNSIEDSLLLFVKILPTLWW